MRRIALLTVLALAIALGTLPANAAPVIERGSDVFTTHDNGRTFYDFADDPIPAGFFCQGSPAFTGRVTFKGLPLETAVPGQLHGADTVVARLDDATFDETGRAVTRVQFQALSLVSSKPLETTCGAFHVHVSLAGTQRVTSMSIYRTEERGGTFVAPLAVDVRLRFVPVSGRAARPLELNGSFTFPAEALPWSFPPSSDAKGIGPTFADTNGDRVPDTHLAGTSNFAAGWDPAVYQWYDCNPCQGVTCHDDGSGKMHCSFPYTPPGCENVLCP